MTRSEEMRKTTLDDPLPILYGLNESIVWKSEERIIVATLRSGAGKPGLIVVVSVVGHGG